MTIFSFMSQYRCSVYSVWKDGWLWKIDNDTTYDVGHQEVICEIFSQNISSAPHILGCFSPVCCPFSHKCAAQGIWILLSQCPASTSWRLTLLVLGYLGVSIIHRSPTKTTQFWTCVWGMFFYRIRGGGGGASIYINVRIDVYVWCCWGLYCAVQINMYHVLSPNWSPLHESKEQGIRKSKQSHKPTAKPTCTPKGSFYANTIIINVHPFTLS